MHLPLRLDKVQRYSLPIIIAAALIIMNMYKFGVISPEHMKYSLFVPAILELIILGFCLFNISRIIRRYKKLKKEGWNTLDAWQKALEVVLSPRIARIALLEPRLYYALFLSYRKKPRRISELSYSTNLKSYIFLVKVLLFICCMEILLVSIFLPQRWMMWKIIHMILGMWAILWLWADYRAMVLYNHQLTSEGINLQVGLRCCQFVLWEDITCIERISRPAPGGMMAPGKLKDDPETVYLGVGQGCNIEIILKEEQSFQGMINDIPAVKRILLSLEQPDELITAIQKVCPN